MRVHANGRRAGRRACVDVRSCVQVGVGAGVSVGVGVGGSVLEVIQIVENTEERTG